MKNKKQSLELYVHIPFCVRKCHYCDFLSGPAKEEVQDAYMEALLKEVEGRSEEGAVVSIFIGGGTPSLVKVDWIVKLLATIRRCYYVEPDAEISIEVNPGSVDEYKLIKYREAGINRLSIGLQSVSDKELTELGRIHTYEQFLDTYECARKVGFSNLNVDLMSALPGQTMDSWKNTLKTVVSLNPKPEHISAYSLIIEEGTVLYRRQEEGTLQLPDEDEDRRMYALTGTFLKEHGYHRYEISNYAMDGYECRHNCGYWKRTQYLGLGLGAASLLKECRFRNGDDLQEYLTNPLGQREDFQELTEKEQMEEFMFLGLRMMTGVSIEAFVQAFGKKPEQVYGEVLEKNLENGLMEHSEGYYRLTDKGIDVSNYVLAQFLF